MENINDVLRSILHDITPKRPPTPAQINRIIMEKKRAQKKRVRKLQRQAHQKDARHDARS